MINLLTLVQYTMLFIIAYIVYLAIATEVNCLSNILWWDKWKAKPFNFPIKYRGKEIWISRACAVTLATFCKNSNGVWCILANKRGEGTPDVNERGKWNMPCGYLDYNEDANDACKRETFEECGVVVPKDKIIQATTISKPSENRQNVTIRHYAILNGTIDEYPTNTDNMEENEVADVRWIPLTEIENYEWAFGHLDAINSLLIDHVQGIYGTLVTIDDKENGSPFGENYVKE